MAITGKFQHKINVVLVTKKVIKLYEVRMVEKGLYFDFSCDLIDGFLFFLLGAHE